MVNLASKFLGIYVVLAGVFAGCSVDSAKSHYVLAERLWTEGNHSGAVTEFDKVTARDPKGKLGIQALYRSATTEANDRGRYREALRKFKQFTEFSRGTPAAYEADLQIGEILFERMEQYEESAAHYREMTKRWPAAKDLSEFYFKAGKSDFFLSRFEDALSQYDEAVRGFPGTPWAERAAFEKGIVLFTRGGSDESYKLAIRAHEDFLAKYPQSPWAVHARFGIANCMEELDQLEQASERYKSMMGEYPIPEVLSLKIARIRERQAQRSR